MLRSTNYLSCAIFSKSIETEIRWQPAINGKRSPTKLAPAALTNSPGRYSIILPETARCSPSERKELIQSRSDNVSSHNSPLTPTERAEGPPPGSALSDLSIREPLMVWSMSLDCPGTRGVDSGSSARLSRGVSAGERFEVMNFGTPLPVARIVLGRPVPLL